MKILNASQIREIDVYTIEHEPIRSIDLMERAAKKCAEWIRKRIIKANKVHVFCGPGNNGGDGLAIARMLSGSGKKLVVYKVKFSNSASNDFIVNEKRLNGLKNLHATDLKAGDSFPEIMPGEVVIDALFGNGLARPLEGYLASLVQHINASKAFVIAIDMPSGLFVDDNRDNHQQAIIKANFTLTFQFPKLAFLMPSNEVYVGEWIQLDIGLHEEAIARAESRYCLLEASDIKAFYRPRSKFSHKGHYGHALLMAGSKGKMGAAILSSRSCIRSGAGLLSVFVPACGYEIMQLSVPEAMCEIDESHLMITHVPSLERFNAIGIGPGIGTQADTARALKKLIQDTHCPLVIDADAINILSENLTWLDFLPKNSVLTPHPKEFDRLVGKSVCDEDRFRKAEEFARRFGVVLVLKGAYTCIAAPDGRCYFNSTGNPGMATGGSGDVLTGMITAWMAQSYSPLISSLMAVFLHGLAGDMAAKTKGTQGLIASDIVDLIPKAILKTTNE